MTSCPEKDTYDGRNLLQEQANLPSFCQDVAEDAQIFCHLHTNN